MSAWQAWLHPRRAAATIREQQEGMRLLIKTLAYVLEAGHDEQEAPKCD